MTRRIAPLAALALLAACAGSPTSTDSAARFDSGLIGSGVGRSGDDGALGSGGGRADAGIIGSGMGREDDSGMIGSGTLSSDGTGTGFLGGGTRAESDTTGRWGGGLGSGT